MKIVLKFYDLSKQCWWSTCEPIYSHFFSNYNLVIVTLLPNDNMFHYSAGYFIVNLEEHLNWCIFVSFYIISQDHPVLVSFWSSFKGFYEAVELYDVILFIRLSCFILKVIMYILFVSILLCILTKEVLKSFLLSVPL